MRSVERDLRLLILAASAGSADGWSFGFGHAFVANMTGNTVLLGLAVSKAYGFQLRSDDNDNVKIFSSLRSLNEHVQRSRTK